jgi:indolepyruvate ferredoxin oxidoreductase
MPQTLSEVVSHRMGLLRDYQDEALAARYRALVERVRDAEARSNPGSDVFALTVARYYYKVLAVKDEYEVARLHADPAFTASIARMFEGDYTLHYHLAPPALARRDGATGRLSKREFGPWMRHAFGALARFKRWRNTALDPFAKTPERREEVALIATYEADVQVVLLCLANGADAARREACLQLLSLPEQIRGFGHVRHAALERTRAQAAALLRSIKAPLSAPRVAEG